MIVLSFLIMAQAGLAAYDPKNPLTSTGLNETASQGYSVAGAELLKDNDLSTIIGKIVGAGLAFLGVIFFVLILYAGLSWILSMGNEEKITESKNMIIAAVLGLIVVLGAYAITMIIPMIFTDAVPK